MYSVFSTNAFVYKCAVSLGIIMEEKEISATDLQYFSSLRTILAPLEKYDTAKSIHKPDSGHTYLQIPLVDKSRRRHSWICG